MKRKMDSNINECFKRNKYDLKRKGNFNDYMVSNKRTNIEVCKIKSLYYFYWVLF